MDTEYFKESGATFSDCGLYRYRLWRKWDSGPTVSFLMLNPSTADENRNDPTIERCHRRAVAMGFSALDVINIFSFRATDPKNLKKAKDPIGPDTDAALLESMRSADMTICAWGSHGDHRQRDLEVRQLLKNNKIPVHYLTLTVKGQPGHPLYIPYSKTPKLWTDL